VEEANCSETLLVNTSGQGIIFSHTCGARTNTYIYNWSYKC